MKRKPKFLIMGLTDSPNTVDLLNELARKGNKADSCDFSELAFIFRNGRGRIEWKGSDVSAYDIFIFRAFNLNINEARITADYLIKKGKVVIDAVVASGLIPSKLHDASRLTLAGIAHPATFQIINKMQVGPLLSKLSFPVVVKPIYAQKGQDIIKCNNKQALKQFFALHEKGYLVQEYIPADGDIRVFVVGDKVLGAIKRHVIPGDFRSNASLGAKAEAVAVTPAMHKMALRAARSLGYEIAGVDIIQHQRTSKYYVLEVNSTPQWQKFKEATGINPAVDIVEYALNKYLTKNSK